MEKLFGGKGYSDIRKWNTTLYGDAKKKVAIVEYYLITPEHSPDDIVCEIAYKTPGKQLPAPP